MTTTLEAQEVHPLTLQSEVRAAIGEAIKSLPLSDNISRDGVVDLLLDLDATVRDLVLAAA